MNLFIFNNLNRDRTINALLKFRDTGDTAAYYEAARRLIKFSAGRLTKGSPVKEYVLRSMLEADNLPNPETVRDFLRRDTSIIFDELLTPDWDGLCRKNKLVPFSAVNVPPASGGPGGYAHSLLGMMNASSKEALMGAMLAHAEIFGTGRTSAFAALRWEGGKLRGIVNADPITFDDLVGLEHQKEVLIANTESFVNGLPANDVLLTGSSGTGKSSCVKACLNMFKDRGLRLVEVKKSDLSKLGKVLDQINNDMLKYIVFIDDLSFEADDPSYKELKVALDGQAEVRERNILIYATSNRRRLIKETWSDRDGGDEIHRSESINERKSLAERFGINLSFLTPTQKEYLLIVREMLAKHNIEMTDEIKSRALSWEIQYNGFSGRTAAQFVTSILSGKA